MDIVRTLRRLGQKLTGWKKAGEELYAQLPLIVKLYKKHGLKLVMTCSACPEQYEVFNIETGEQVAYLRLRHGYFTVDYPNCGGQEVYQAEPNGDGCFDANERLIYMNNALKAILNQSTNTPT